MLSVLIPCYNYNVFPLVTEIYKQCIDSNINFEIIVLDDASPKPKQENDKINELANCSFIILEKNIGRSAIRNLLANKANFQNLLFLDADTIPKNSDFISNYIPFLNKKDLIVNGGILYQVERPKKNKLFRWVYGKKRESIHYKKRQQNPYTSFLTLNFLIPKAVFSTVSFNENIPNLRYEDVLFSYNLMQYNYEIEHINNPVIHLGIDDFNIALKKEHESIIALKHLLDNQLLPVNYIKISRIITLIKKLKLSYFVLVFHKISRTFILKNLESDNPSLFLFDLYRLGYFFNLKV